MKAFLKRNTHGRWSAVLLAVALLAGVTASVSAQVLYGSIVGNVRDETGAALPGATVTITSRDTNLERVAVTNETGSYSFANVLPGTYTVKISLQGFREHSQTGVPVVIGQISRVDVGLQLGALTETVLVESRAALLQTDKADVNTELDSEEIKALPLNQFRNYQALINLVPGATPAQFQNAETDTPGRSLTTNVNGQNRNNNATTTDGATNLNVWLPHHVMYVSPAESIETVNISTNNFDAEQGMAGGAAITVVTKSGTNEFRGSAFEFHNNESLNATPYFFGNDPNGKPDKLPITTNIFGGTLGGPIVRNKLFFFGSFEGYKSSRTVSQGYSVPDAALRAGDFSGALNSDGSQQIIYNPFTGNPDGTGRVPFPGNIIPANMLHPIAQQINDLLVPLPNSGGTGLGNLSNNYLRDETRTTDRYNYDVKVNYNASSAAQIWGKFSYMDATVDDLTDYLGPDPNSTGDGGLTDVKQWTGGTTWTLTPTMVWDATFGFSRQDQSNIGSDFEAGNFGLDVLGIPGTNGGSNYSDDQRYAGYPAFFNGFTAVGNNDTWVPAFRDERTYSFRTNLSKVMGRHDVRAGYTMNYLYLDHWQPEIGNPRGALSFDGDDTALRGGQTSNFYNQYASFMLGLIDNANRSIQFEEMTTREWQHGLYVRDRWAVNDKFTLDLGLRWEYYPIMHRADRGLERVDFNTMEVLLGGLGGNPENVGLEAQKDHFAPRVGAIYRLNEETVVRGGFGVTYNPGPWGRPLRGFYPLTIAADFFNNEPFAYYSTLDQGIPEIDTPDISTGRIPLPNAVDMRSPEPGNVERGAIKSWNVAVERRLMADLSLDVAYVGSAGDGGYADVDINAPTVLGGGNESRPFFDEFGRNRNLRLWGARSKTRYQSLQVALNRPFKNGLLLKGAYTLSKAQNEVDDDGWASYSWNSPFALDRNYGLAGYDRTHNFQLGFLYQLPYRSEGSYDSVAQAILGDWQLNGVFGAFSGTPFTVTANGAELNTPSNTQTADLVGSVTHVGEIGGSGTYYDPSAWAQPTGVRFGTSTRNEFRGPGGINLDLSLFRSFPMGGTRRIELRVEGFNITNTPKFGNPNGNVNSGSFMVVGGTLNSYAERQFRLGIRFEF